MHNRILGISLRLKSILSRNKLQPFYLEYLYPILRQRFRNFSSSFSVRVGYWTYTPSAVPNHLDALSERSRRIIWEWQCISPQRWSLVSCCFPFSQFWKRANTALLLPTLAGRKDVYVYIQIEHIDGASIASPCYVIFPYHLRLQWK
jgi:hypothetical protein